MNSKWWVTSLVKFVKKASPVDQYCGLTWMSMKLRIMSAISAQSDLPQKRICINIIWFIQSWDLFSVITANVWSNSLKRVIWIDIWRFTLGKKISNAKVAQRHLPLKPIYSSMRKFIKIDLIRNLNVVKKNVRKSFFTFQALKFTSKQSIQRYFWSYTDKIFKKIKVNQINQKW